MISGKVYHSEDPKNYLIDMRPIFTKFPGELCPEDLRLQRNELGWIYNTDKKIREKYDRERIETCINMTLAGVYEIKRVFQERQDKSREEKIKRSTSWKLAEKNKAIKK